MRTRLALLILLPVVGACRADEPIAPAEVPAGTTALRVVNAAPRAVDVIVDGRVMIASLPARTVSQRVAFGAGTHAVRLRNAGSTGGAELSVVASAGQTSTLAALPSADDVSVTALADTGAAPVAGFSKLRVIHFAASAPAIAVWRTQPDYQTPIQVGFPFRYGTQSPYLQSTPGAWVVWVTPADATAPTLASSGPMTIAGGEVRTVVILDAAGGGVQVKPLE